MPPDFDTKQRSLDLGFSTVVQIFVTMSYCSLGEQSKVSFGQKLCAQVYLLSWRRQRLYFENMYCLFCYSALRKHCSVTSIRENFSAILDTINCNVV